MALFLQELRGVWPGACPLLDHRGAQADRHLGLLRGEGPDELGRLVIIAGVPEDVYRRLFTVRPPPRSFAVEMAA